MSQVRLQKFMASAGVASRRHAEELITAGRVKVNGKVVTELGTKVDPARDTVQVDGSLAVARDHVYILLNKPKGYITTVEDPQGRPTVMQLLPPDTPKGVVPVGRLDFYTEGVLLFTNDGELAAALLHPRRHVEKTYHVKIRGEVRPDDIQKLRDGVTLDDGRKTMPAKVDLLEFTGKHTWLVMTIKEGRSRQIHRMAEALGYQVIKLARVAFGGLTYFGLKIGEHRRLTDHEIRALRHTAGLDLSEEERARTREEASRAAALIDREERRGEGRAKRARGMQQRPPEKRSSGLGPRTSGRADRPAAPAKKWADRPSAPKPFAKTKWAAEPRADRPSRTGSGRPEPADRPSRPPRGQHPEYGVAPHRERPADKSGRRISTSRKGPPPRRRER